MWHRASPIRIRSLRRWPTGATLTLANSSSQRATTSTRRASRRTAIRASIRHGRTSTTNWVSLTRRGTSRLATTTTTRPPVTLTGASGIRFVHRKIASRQVLTSFCFCRPMKAGYNCGLLAWQTEKIIQFSLWRVQILLMCFLFSCIGFPHARYRNCYICQT